MIKNVMLVSTVFLLTGCFDLKGTLTTLSTLEMTDSYGDKEVIDADQELDAVISYNSDKELVLKIDRSFWEGADLKIIFAKDVEFDKQKSIQYINIPASKDFQKYAIKGKLINKSYRTSNLKYGSENCSEVERYNTNDSMLDRDLHKIKKLNGQRKVTYYDAEELKEVQADLVDRDNRVVAKIKAADKMDYRDYVTIGNCIIK